MKTYTLTSVRESGSAVRLELLSSDGEVMRHRMTSRIWESFHLSKGDTLLNEDYLKVADISERCEAVTKALKLLSEQTLSCMKLKEKLKRGGISAEAAADAVAVALRRGLIDEEAQAEEFALRCAEKKHRGRTRITATLISHGYRSDTSRRAADKVPQGVYIKGIKCQLSARCPDGIPCDRAEKDRLIAAIVRQGFTVGEVLSVIEEIE